MILFILLKWRLEIVTQMPQEFLPFSHQIPHQIFLLKSHCFRFCALAFKWNSMCPTEETSVGTYYVQYPFQSSRSVPSAWMRSLFLLHFPLMWLLRRSIREGTFIKIKPAVVHNILNAQIKYFFKGTISVNGFLPLSSDVTDFIDGIWSRLWMA